MNKATSAILHYSAPPVVGGVESVMQAHARLLRGVGRAVMVVAGNGKQEALPQGVDLVQIPEMDSQHPHIVQISRELEQGRVPGDFAAMVTQITQTIRPVLQRVDLVMIHNVFTKHFNLPLTAALYRLLDQGAIKRGIAWCHDFTWTSPHSRSKVFPGYPWDLLRTHRRDVTYVTISQTRQRELAGLFHCPLGQIKVIYNGVHPDELLGISEAELALIDRLGLWDSDLNLLMPVRVTQAKNIELGIHVVAELKKRGIVVKLIVTGPPDPHDPENMAYFQSLKSLRHQLDVDEELRFVYESGPDPNQAFQVDMSTVGALFRVSDALFMPSRREGFGMPIVESGLAGLPIFCSENVPAAGEIGGEDVVRFLPDTNPPQVADLILGHLKNDHVYNLKRRMRREFTWRSIFRHEILPLLEEGVS